MSLVNLLDTLVGLIMIWLFLSLAIMNMQEWIAGKLHLRSRMLEQNIRKLLGISVANAFYRHPIIRGLSTGASSQHKPSYISSNQFALVLLDIVQSLGSEITALHYLLSRVRSSVHSTYGKRMQPALIRLDSLLEMLAEARLADGNVPADQLDAVYEQVRALAADFPRLYTEIYSALKVIEEIKRKTMQDGNHMRDSQSETFEPTRGTSVGLFAINIAEPGLAQTLQALLGSVRNNLFRENDLDFLRINIQNWFNGSMDRLTGWYKRRALLLTFTLALSIAVLGNIDSLLISKFLWRQADLRSAAYQQVQFFLDETSPTAAANPLEELTTLQDRLVNYKIPFGWFTSASKDSSGEITIYTAENCSLTATDSDKNYGVLFGNQCFSIINAPLISDSIGWLQKALGLLITAIASAQGAPFWFDILKKFVNVRSSGANPAESTKPVG